MPALVVARRVLILRGPLARGSLMTQRVAVLVPHSVLSLNGCFEPYLWPCGRQLNARNVQ